MTIPRNIIRDTFLANGFTIKEGQNDLKPYVYAAAEALLAIASIDGQLTEAPAPVKLGDIHPPAGMNEREAYIWNMGRDSASGEVEAWRRANGLLAQSRDRWRAAAKAQADDGARDRVRDAVAQAMSGVYYCGRVWSAWGMGTMSADDFTEAAEVDEVLDGITDAAIAAMKPEGGA